MTFTEAAAEVLRLAGKPLHYKEITELAIEKNLLSHVGKSPEVTMGARLAALLKKEDKTNPIVRVKPGVFALREWSEKKGGRAAKAAPAEDADDGNDVNALEVEAANAPAISFTEEEEGDDEPIIVSGEDALRADLAASGAELFDDEDDDDQPILAGPSTSTSTTGTSPTPATGPEGGADGGRRRRRRRRRGRGGSSMAGDLGSAPREGTAPAAPSSAGAVDGGGENGDASRDLLAPSPRPQIRDRQQIMAGGLPSGIDVPLGEGDELAGKELADAAIIIFGAFDRNGGPVALRSIVDQLMRRGRLAGDPTLAAVQLSASLRADNLRRQAQGQRPRFRFATGARVAPTDWILGSELARLEQDAIVALERYRDGARRTFLRRMQELPGHAFVELALLALERIGVGNIRTVRRAGSPGGEAHFAAVHRTGADEIRTALVIRKDGREIGRERVSDVRGALHHYGPATCGWLITTGQVLSGAREEAATVNAPPVALFDGLAFTKLLEDNDVGVIRTKHSKHIAAGGAKFIINPGKDPSACFQCHLDVQAEFSLPQHHQVVEGRLSCVQCHDPHGGDMLKPKGGLAMARQDESCAQCHREQTRPFVFEHEALREGCAVCHNPHGSINQKMLVASDPNLCLRCHAQVQGPGVPAGSIYIGNTDHTSLLQIGTCWTAGCHTAIHGSNVDPRLRY